MAPYFSIIIPTLNEEKYIPRLLTDLKNQTERSFTVTIVDGKSQDSTVAQVKKFSKKLPIKIIISNKESVSEQRNVGALHAKGAYLLFLDADVMLPHDFLAKIKEKTIKNNTAVAGIKFQFSRAGLIDQFSASFTNWAFYIFCLLGKAFISGQCMLFKREIFEKLKGFDVAVVHAEDIELSQRAQRNGYKISMYMDICYYTSPRRIVREGRLKLWLKYFMSNLHILFVGPIRKPIFEYKMGGKI